MEVWRKQSVRYRLNGKTVPKGTPDAEKVAIPSKRFYGTLTDAEGKRRQIPLCEEREASVTLLRRLQTEADRDRASGVPVHVQERRRPIGELLDAYETYLESKADTPRHVQQTISAIRRLLDQTKTKALGDLDASLSQTLADWRRRKKRPLHVRTTNYYARAVKGFSRWLWQERKTPDDALVGLRLLNAKAEAGRKRRALTPQEMRRLAKATEESRKTVFGLRPKDRAMLYRVACYTGLRASELASLTVSSFDLEAGTVSVQAAYSKRRRDDVLPLHASLIGLLSQWLATKQSGTLWKGTWANKHKVQAAKMLRRDLTLAGVAQRDE